MYFWVMKHIKYFWLMFMISCAGNQPDSDVKQQVSNNKTDSIAANGDSVQRYVEVNAEALINKTTWKPSTGVVNVSISTDQKKYYAIMLTDGQTNVILTYSGKEKTGRYRTGNDFKASVLNAQSVPYVCNNGYIEFTQFDTINRKMSAHFSLKCMKNETSTDGFNISEASFTDLSW